MAEYIDREALLRITEQQGHVSVDDIVNEPAADVAPVVHGRIVESWEAGYSKRIFSCCGTDCTKMTQWMRPNFCPHCGAKMDL